MSIEDRMTIDERRKYLKKMQERYLQADRAWNAGLEELTKAGLRLRYPVLADHARSPIQ